MLLNIDNFRKTRYLIVLMRRKTSVFLPLLLVCLHIGALGVFAQANNGAGDLFYKGYMLKTEAEKLEKAGDLKTAYSKFQQAQQVIGTVSQNYPEWQPEVVTYRLRLIEQALTRLSRASSAPAGSPPNYAQNPVQAAPQAGAVAAPGMAPPQSFAAAPVAPGSEIANPLDIINQTFEAQRKQNAELQSKLRLYEDGYTNALRERQKAQQESDLLNKQLQDLTAKAEALAQGMNAKDEQARQELEKAQNEAKMVRDMLTGRSQQLIETGKAIESLQKEKDALVAERQKLEDELAKTKRESVKPDEFAKIITENTRLKQELEVARVQVETLKKEGVRKDEELVAMRTQIEGLQSEMSKLRQENTAYQGQVAELTVKLKKVNEDLMASSEGKPLADVEKVTQENKALRGIILRQLREQQRQLQTKELVLAEMKKMENTSQTLIENLEDMASSKGGLSAEEEALFTAPELEEINAADTRLYATLEAVSTNKKAEGTSSSSTEAPALPPDGGEVTEASLLQQAEQALAQSDFKTAETAYQDALRANPKNNTALGNLAWIKLQQKRYDEAEVLLQKSLFYAPDDDTAHYRLGICYFQQDKLADALSSFEKSVIKQRDNARAHHYLGIITNKQGNRPRAEAEFKSALAIDPNYAPAHFNLAVLYATSSPPDWSLARKHYQTAIDQGVKADPALEKLLQPASNAAPAANLKERAATANVR